MTNDPSDFTFLQRDISELTERVTKLEQTRKTRLQTILASDNCGQPECEICFPRVSQRKRFLNWLKGKGTSNVYPS